jgi:hypothetical protein
MIDMMQHSQVFSRFIKGHALWCNYEINGHQYTKWYYLPMIHIQDGRYLWRQLPLPLLKRSVGLLNGTRVVEKMLSEHGIQSYFAIVRSYLVMWKVMNAWIMQEWACCAGHWWSTIWPTGSSYISWSWGADIVCFFFLDAYRNLWPTISSPVETDLVEYTWLRKENS